MELLDELRRRDIKLWREGESLRFSAPTGALSPELRARLAEHKAELLTHLSDSPGVGTAIPRTARDGGIPLSFAQEQLWVLDRLEPGLNAYNVAHCWRIAGPFDSAALERSLQEIVRRHEILRTTFSTADDGTPVQMVHEVSTPPVRLVSIAPGALPRLADEEAARPFDIVAGPLWHATIARLGENEHALMVTCHHIICDAWSVAIIARELTALYAAFHAGQPDPLPDLPLQYGDYARWQRNLWDEAAMAPHLAFWQARLGDDRAPLAIPADRPRPARQTHRGALLTRDLSPELSRGLRNLARLEGVTLFMLTLAAFKALLARYCGETDIVVGSPIAQRPRPETEKLIGFFLNMLALRTELSGDPPFRELLQRVRSTVLEAFQHQDVPFEKVVEVLHPSRNLSHQPLFQVAFVLQPPGETAPAFPGAEVLPVPIPVTTAKFDLTLFIEETPGGMRAMMEYTTDQFDAATVDRMLESFESLTEGIITDPSTPLSRLPILSAAQRQRTLTEWTGAGRPCPRHGTVAARFAENAAKTPGAVAVIDGLERLTFGELEARANRVAHSLQSRGIRPGAFVGLRAERSLAFVVKVLGIAKAGAAYVPLGDDEPAARLAPMKAACALILDSEPDGDVPADPVASDAQPDDPAYVLFTSGSTGVPKGVIIPHRGIMRLVVDNDYAPFQSDDVVAFASNVCFDAATFEIWGALLNGATLVAMPHEVLLSTGAFTTFLTQHRITTLFLTTALFNQIALENPAAFRSLKHLLFGGEACNPDCVRRVLDHGAPQRLLHVYGPTETTTFASWHPVREVPSDAVGVPIGRPIANTTIHILDAHLQPVPLEVTGEIFIGGPGLAIGYLNDPKLTAQRFLESPYGRLYRTGDLGRRRADGAIDFQGRMDSQVKIRGFRIEPGEIETALQQHPLVRHAAVVAHSEAGAAHSLIGYLVPSSTRRADTTGLREFLARRLPAYMIPSSFVWMDALPLTPNGKLDAKRLPPPDPGEAATAIAPVPPRNQIERGIAGIWERVLKRGVASVHDDFFTVGGHSLLALRLLGEIRKDFEIEVPARRLFEAPTIAGLAAFVSEQKSSAPCTADFLVPVQTGSPAEQPLFLVAGGWGGEIEFLVYGELSRQIDPALPIWGLKARGAGTGDPPHTSVKEMAADYVRSIRRIQPHGPYLIGGECVGGICAYEMACQLENTGEQVALLVLLDTVVPAEKHLEYYLNAESQKRAAESRSLSIPQRIRHHLTKMENLRLGDKLAYVLSKTLRLGRSRPAGDGAAPEQHPRGQKDYPVTLLRHRLKPYGGTVTLLLDDESSRLYGQMGWDKAPVAHLETHILPGDHLTYIRANAATAAAKLRELLRMTRLHHDPATA